MGICIVGYIYLTVCFVIEEFGGRSNETRQVWNEKEIACKYFSLRILSGQLIPAGEFDEVKYDRQ